MVYDLSGHLISEYGFNGHVGWNLIPDKGFEELTGPLLVAMRRDAEFYRELKLKELFPKITLNSKDTFSGRQVYIIDATPVDGPPQRMYFDAQTGLLLRRDEEVTIPQGSMQFAIYLEDYKEVDGIKLPFTIRRLSSNGGTTLTVTEVKHNIAIDDAKFNPPGQ